MTLPRFRFRNRWAATAALLALVWFCAPHLAGGFWRGDYFECLCSADLVAEFVDGQVLTHMEPSSDPLHSPGISGVISTKPAGSYRRTGWHSFEWLQPSGRGGATKLKFTPGWIFCRVEDLATRETWWGVRELNLFRIMRIRAHQQRVLQQGAPANVSPPSGSGSKLTAAPAGSRR